MASEIVAVLLVAGLAGLARLYGCALRLGLLTACPGWVVLSYVVRAPHNRCAAILISIIFAVIINICKAFVTITVIDTIIITISVSLSESATVVVLDSGYALKPARKYLYGYPTQ